jgi:hypothetical protein
MAKVNPVAIVRNGIAKMPTGCADEPEASSTRLSGVFSIFQMATRRTSCTCGFPNDQHIGMCPSITKRAAFIRPKQEQLNKSASKDLKNDKAQSKNHNEVQSTKTKQQQARESTKRIIWRQSSGARTIDVDPHTTSLYQRVL